MTSLHWAVGDRCFVDGHVARISKIIDSQGTRFAKLWRSGGVSMFRPVYELELVPLPEADTVPAPKEDA